MKANSKPSAGTNRPIPSLASWLGFNPLSEWLPALALALSILPSQLVAATKAEAQNQGAQKWSIEVNSVDSADVNPDPDFAAAIYENLLEELAKTKEFKQLLREGNHSMDEVPDILVLKTTVQKYNSGNQRRGGLTAPAEATKLNAHIQLFAPDNRLVLDQVVVDSVRLTDTRWRTAHNLARAIASTLNKATLPELTVTGETTKAFKYQVATITAVGPHDSGSNAGTSVASYDVSLRVGDAAYVVLYAPPPDSVDTIHYGAGGEVHVLLGENTITFHDEFGNSFQAPILTKTTTSAASKQ
jgi:hypothetical protein